MYNSSDALKHFLIDEEISLDLLIKKIVLDNNWKDFKIFESSNKKSLFLNNFFTQSFNNSNFNNQIKNKNIICDQIRSNISSINLSYFSKC